MKYSEYKRLRNILLELFGTATIVYFTNWANLLYELKQVQLSTLGIIYGMVVSLMVYISQNRSGAHFDPAVTISYLSFNRVDFTAAIPYIGAQILGGGIAGYIISKQLSDEMSAKLREIGPLGIPMPDEKNLLLGLFMETFAVMIIHIVRISLLIDNRGNKESNGVAIGAAYTMFVMASAEISGACFNPARALGPFFFMDGVGASSQLLMAICPFVGCTLAMALYKQFLMSESLEEELDEL